MIINRGETVGDGLIVWQTFPTKQVGRFVARAKCAKCGKFCSLKVINNGSKWPNQPCYHCNKWEPSNQCCNNAPNCTHVAEWVKIIKGD